MMCDDCMMCLPTIRWNCGQAGQLRPSDNRPSSARGAELAARHPPAARGAEGWRWEGCAGWVGGRVRAARGWSGGEGGRAHSG